MAIVFRLNGEAYRHEGDPMAPLVDVLRRGVGLTGTKAVCREGFCGACMVHVDGVPKLACLMPVGLAGGCAITTIEGLGGAMQRLGERFPDALRQAFIDEDVVQCGMCFPGMVMSLGAWLAEHPRAGRAEIKEAILGNACRCSGYERIVDAVMLCLRRMGG